MTFPTVSDEGRDVVYAAMLEENAAEPEDTGLSKKRVAAEISTLDDEGPIKEPRLA